MRGIIILTALMICFPIYSGQGVSEYDHARRKFCDAGASYPAVAMGLDAKGEEKQPQVLATGS